MAKTSSIPGDRTPHPRLVERAREDLLLFAGNLLAGRYLRSESAERHASCSFCGRPREAVKTLIQGRSFAICEGCVVEGARLFSRDSQFDEARRFGLREAVLSCSACGRTQIQVKGLFAANGRRLCDACLFACLTLLVEQGILQLDSPSRARSTGRATRVEPRVPQPVRSRESRRAGIAQLD